jgi:hypothetical protein
MYGDDGLIMHAEDQDTIFGEQIVEAAQPAAEGIGRQMTEE